MARQISDKLKSQYGYDPGTYGAANMQRNSDKFLVRLDYNISDKHRLSLRDKYVTGYADDLECSANILNFGNQGFRHSRRTNSLVAELKSTLSNHVSNQLIVGRNTVSENRIYDGRIFPHLEINYNTSTSIFAGTYREAAAQQYAQLDQYIANDVYLSTRRGTYAERNAARTPWTQQLDLRLIAKVPPTKTGSQRLEVSFDFINLGNLLNREWGLQYFVPNFNNLGYALMDFVRIDAVKNQPVYQFRNPTSTPSINSRWQGQVGVRYVFN